MTAEQYPELVTGVACPVCGMIGQCRTTGRHAVGKLAECAACGQRDLLIGQTFSWNFDGEARGNHNLVWHVTNILLYLQDHPRRTVELPLRVIDYCAENNMRDDWHAGHEYAMATDLSRPLIVIPTPRKLLVENGLCCPVLPIDGWNRIYKAHKTRQTLRAIPLTEQEEQRFRILDVIAL